MSVQLDVMYVGLVGSRLDKFKQARSRLWLCRCPICGDSKKKANKRRFYIFSDHSNAECLFVKCHNCSYSNSFGKFLEEFDQGLYKEYRLELFKERSGVQTAQTTNPIQTQPVAPDNPIPAPSEAIPPPKALSLPTIAQLPDDHPAKLYVLSRCLPLWTHGLLMYTANFKEDFKDFSVEASLMELPEDARLVIPFYNRAGELKVVQGRALGKSSLRYISLKKCETDTKVFGLDRVDTSRTVLVVEGPIDSLFLPNCIATADADLLSAGIGDLIIHDFEPRNKEIMRRLLTSIEKGKKVVIPPDNYPHKDVNDMVKDGGLSPRDLVQFMGKHCYQGLAARMRFSKYCLIKL